MGPMEILLILLVALLVFGPEKLPEIASTLGRTVRALRRSASEMSKSWEEERRSLEKEVRQTASEVSGSLEGERHSLEKDVIGKQSNNGTGSSEPSGKEAKP